MVFYGFEDGRNCFLVDCVYVFFPLVFNRDEVAVEEGFEVVGYHALFLSEGLGEFVYAHGFVHELFEGGKSGWVCEVGEEVVANGCKGFFHVYPRQYMNTYSYELLFI